MSDSGSDSRIASGSRNDPNCTTSTKYISRTATPSATRMRPNTSCWSSRLAALRDRVARRQRERSPASPSMSRDHLRQRAVLGVRLHVITRSRSRWSIRAGPMPGSMLRHLAERHRRRAGLGPGTTSGSALEVGDARPRLGREPHRHVARLARAGRPSRRRRCRRTRAAATAPPGRRSRRACRRARGRARTSSSGFWPFVERPTSTAPGVCAQHVGELSAPGG